MKRYRSQTSPGRIPRTTQFHHSASGNQFLVRMAEAFLKVVLENLNSLIQKELGLLYGVNKEMQKLSSTLSTIQAVLQDAEEKKVRDKTIKNWLKKLKDAAYDMDDILEEFSTEASRLEFESQESGMADKVCTSFMTSFSPKNILIRHKIANRMKGVQERLDEIAEERMKFHLLERQVESEERCCQTSSIITQSAVYGRDEEQEAIVEYLLEGASAFDDVSVYPIVGMGGLGKTTLAQLVLNDERVRRHFDLTVWVYVSQDFDIKRVIKAIIQSASGNACEALDLDPLQKRLQEMLNMKRYLIVLDDLWNEDQEKWDRLKHVLACGSKGASIIVTTRLQKVASIVGTVPAHHMSGLSEDDCWSLFRERAFGNGMVQVADQLVAIGKEIVTKCGGVPLAAKTLGSLMRFKREEIQWLHVKESELWNLPQDENSILPALSLSYFNLPLKLRQCFAYCAIFPKASEIRKGILVRLWMANGFISSDGRLEAEDVGNEICNELYLRSLFQDAGKDDFGNIDAFKMHDLVHDLAQSVMEDECCILDPENSSLSGRIRHVTIPYSEHSFTIPDAVCKAESLRTLLLLRSYPSCYDQVVSKFSCNFTKFHSLRVFVASHSRLTKLSSSVGNLKHLKYLDLSFTKIRILPSTICRLMNLQTLYLTRCLVLQRLPKNIRLLKNLRHLCISGCPSLSYLPPKIGQLTCLKTLSQFIVNSWCPLAELKILELRGHIYIRHLERVGNPMDAREANLSKKRGLRSLNLFWKNSDDTESVEHAEKVLESLEPHRNLKYLEVAGYKGTCFPFWMNDATLDNVVSIALKSCRNCIHFPSLGRLGSLRHLSLERMDYVQCLDNRSCCEGSKTAFPCLETLLISDLPRLERLLIGEGREPFPRLTHLTVTNCPKLSLPCSLSLTELDIRGCSAVLLNSISNMRSLCFFRMAYNDEVMSFPDGMLQNLNALKQLQIEYFTKLKVLPGDLVGLHSLDTLCIVCCHELESLPGHGLRDLTSLQSLSIVNCGKFKSLSDGIQHLTSLQWLNISGCPELVALPDVFNLLVSLKELTLSGQSTAGNGYSKPITSKLSMLPESLANVSTLEHLRIYNYLNLESLPSFMGNLTSLQSLYLHGCTKLTSLPTSIENLTNLKILSIRECPQLMTRCKKQTGEEWCIIAHIANVYLDDKPQI